MGEPTVDELQEHWDGCAGAEATINDLHDRVERTEAEVGGLKRKVLALAEERAAYFERAEKAEAERDEARRVAKVLARVAFCSPDYDLACRDEPALEAAVAAARAYPERPPSVHSQDGKSGSE